MYLLVTRHANYSAALSTEATAALMRFRTLLEY